MRNKLYAPPLANLEAPPRAACDDRFYVVATRKMLLLYSLTLGMYQLYWYYRHWSQFNRATNAGVWPLPRAVFAVFSTHSLFHQIGAHDVTGKRDGWDSGSYAAAMVFLLVAGYVLMWAGGDSLFFALLTFSLLLPIGLVMLQVQREANARCGDPEGASNSAFSGANYAWCVLGGLFWLLVLAGLALETLLSLMPSQR